MALASFAPVRPAVGATPSGWNIVTSPNTDPSQSNLFMATTCANAWSCWAVGGVIPTLGGNSQPNALIDSWNGSTWSINSRCYTAWDRCVLALECHMRRRVGLLGSRWSRADRAARPSDSCGALGRFDLVGRTDASGRRLSLFGHLLRFCGLLGRWRQQRCPRKSAERNHLPLGRLAVVPGRRPAIGTNLRSTRICDVHQQLGLLGGGDCRTKPDPVQLLARYCSERRRSKCTYRALGRDSLVGGSEQ